jgi:hypothetical protein
MMRGILAIGFMSYLMLALVAGPAVAQTPPNPSNPTAPVPFSTVPHPGIGNVVTPYRFSPPPRPLAPADEQKALNYRAQLQSQQRDLERLQSQGRLSPSERQQLLGTQIEINRMNGVLHP